LPESEIFIFFRAFFSAFLIVWAHSAALASNATAGLETLSGEKCELKGVAQQSPSSVFEDDRQILCGWWVGGWSVRLSVVRANAPTGG
jgi:hypothetical protein